MNEKINERSIAKGVAIGAGGAMVAAFVAEVTGVGFGMQMLLAVGIIFLANGVAP
jgi:hypothetical protein